MWDIDNHEYRVEEDRGDFKYTWKVALLSLLTVVPILGGLWVLRRVNDVICYFIG